jgi:hypothetical protein
MSIAVLHAGTSASIWGSAANALATPSAALAAFKPAAPKNVTPAPARHISDAMQGKLTDLQQSGAFATDIMQALSAYRR